MNAGTSTWAHFGLSTDSECDCNTTSFPLQGPPGLDEGWTIARPLDISICSYYPQVDEEAYPSCLHQPLHSTIPAIDESVEIPLPETLIADIQDEGSPVTSLSHPSEMDSLCQRAFSWFTTSSLRGFEGPWPASVTSPANEAPRNLIFAGVDTICNWHQEGVLVNSLDHGHRIRDHTNSDFSIPSWTLPSISLSPPYQEQGESRDQLKQIYKIGKGPAAVSESSPSSRRPGGRRGTPQGRYWCSICGLNYAQLRGVTRHHRDAHEVSLCMYCGDFEWHRRPQLKKHLEEQHTDVDISAALGEATRSRRKATRTKTRLRRVGQRSSPAIEHDLPRRPSMPPPAIAKSTPVFYPDMTFSDYDPQHESTESAVLKFKYAQVAFPTTEERTPSTDLRMSALNVEVWGKRPSVGPGRCTTTARPSNQDLAPHITPLI